MEQAQEMVNLQTNQDFNVMLVTVQPNTDIIGIKYLHAYLQKNEITSRILILPLYNESMNKSVEEFFNRYKPALVGFGVLSEEFPAVEKLTQFLKTKFEFATFMGGHQATIDPDKCLKYADYVLRGESEDTLLEICQKMRNGEQFLDTPNLVYKKDGQVVKNSMRLPETNLDKFPYTQFLHPGTYVFDDGKISLIDKRLFRKYSRYNGRFYTITTTRGCNFKCSFCIHSFNTKMYAEEKLNVPKIRTRSVDNVIEELKFMKSEYPDTIYMNVYDDNFFAHDIEWIREFSQKYKKEVGIPIVLRAIPIWFTEEKAKLMKECGLTWIISGLQTGSEKVQKEIYERYVSNEQFLKTTEIMHKLNFCAYYDVILDSPFETDEDILKTVDVILKIKKPYQLQLFSLTFFPGTVIHDIAQERGMDVDDPFSKSYFGLKKTYLNRAIRLIPLLPNSFMKFLVRNKNNKIAKMSMPMIYYPSIFILEPMLWLKMVNMGYGGNLRKTVKTLKSFMKTGVKQMLFHVPQAYNVSIKRWLKKTD